MLWNIVVPLAIAYAAIVALVYFFQPRLVYFPQIGRDIVGTPQAYGLDFESVNIPTEDGETLGAWWVPAKDARGTILFFHGNAGNISHRIDYLLMFRKLGYATLIVDYRGYGKSTGSPSEEGTYRDATAAWRWLTQTRGIQPRRHRVCSASRWAGAVATWLAVQHPPRALVLLSTFTSAPDLGAQVYPFIPVRLISRIQLRQPGEPPADQGAGAGRAQPRRRHRPVCARQAAVRGCRRAETVSRNARRAQRRLHFHARGMGEGAGGFSRTLRWRVTRSKELAAD